MNSVYLHGAGAVSPAGWGLPALYAALDAGAPLPTQELQRPGRTIPLLTRQTPPPRSRPAFMSHPRLRRASPITHFAVGAALEALGDESTACPARGRLGLIWCAMIGCTAYSCRLYKEVLDDPKTASPMIFPETVFNAPLSHMAALLGTEMESCTLLGDDGVFLHALALAGAWLLGGKVDSCLVIASDETDWIPSEGLSIFGDRAPRADGAGVIYLKAGPPPKSEVTLRSVTDPWNFVGPRTRKSQVARMRSQLPAGNANDWLFSSIGGFPSNDDAEICAWSNWPGRRIDAQKILGHGHATLAAWQCAAAYEAIRRRACTAAAISVVGVNEQAVGAWLEATPSITCTRESL